MSNNNLLPQKVDPFRFADQKVSIDGFLRLSDMDRLKDTLASNVGNFFVSLDFNIDKQGIAVVDVSYSGKLALKCQRCMEVYNLDISNKAFFGLIIEKKAGKSYQGYDLIFIENNEFFIKSFIEDELILSIPVVPMHELSDCNVTLPYTIKSAKNEEVKKDNPFKVVELLRSKGSIDK
ncbi:YceD family protein [Gammaproteobacteria bacterium]|nr:YceD family protein [Gammaproteobacteria bacterium]